MNVILEISNIFLNFYNQVFSLFNRFFVITVNGRTVGLGWLILAGICLSMVITVFWKGAKG